jgi:transcriptional regulator ATRX
VVADEAHTIKNPKNRTSQALRLIKTRCRLALTGYPLQNNLMEYYCMIAWVSHGGGRGAGAD